MSIQYKGTWNASTNTPSLSNGTGTEGDLYLVSVAGTRSLGDETINFAVGDRVVYGSNKWTVNNSTALTSDILTALSSIEAGIAINPVSKFAYNQRAYNDNDVNGKSVYNANDDNTIPVGTAEVMKVNDTVVNKGWRAQASSLTRMLMNHFIGRLSYNMNKIHDSFNLFVRAFKASLGQPYGIATLDDTGRIPASQLAVSTIEYKGAWNANTNTPQLADGTGTEGDLYIVSVAGTQNLGSGNISFLVNDRVIYNGSVWQRLQSGSVVSVNNISPDTSTGNVTINGKQILTGISSTPNMSITAFTNRAIDNICLEEYDTDDHEIYYPVGTYLRLTNGYIYRLTSAMYGGGSETDVPNYGVMVHVTDELNLKADISYVDDKIGALDVASAGGSEKYIEAISETDGKINATAKSLATSVDFDEKKPVTGEGIVKTLPFYKKSLSVDSNSTVWVKLVVMSNKRQGTPVTINLSAHGTTGNETGESHVLTLACGYWESQSKYDCQLLDVAQDIKGTFSKLRVYTTVVTPTVGASTLETHILVQYNPTNYSRSISCSAYGLSKPNSDMTLSVETVSIGANTPYRDGNYIEYKLGTDGININGDVFSHLTTYSGDLDFSNTAVADSLPSDGLRIYRATNFSGYGFVNNDGYLINMPWGSGLAKFQIMIDDDSKTMLVRAFSGGSWLPWAQILTTDSEIKALTSATAILYSDIDSPTGYVSEDAITWHQVTNIPSSFGFGSDDGILIDIPWSVSYGSRRQFLLDDENNITLQRSYKSSTSTWSDWERIVTNKTLMPDYARGILNPSTGHYRSYTATEDCYVIYNQKVTSYSEQLELNRNNVTYNVGTVVQIGSTYLASFSGYVKKGDAIISGFTDMTSSDLQVYGLTQ